jgi:hypothetical protein
MQEAKEKAMKLTDHSIAAFTMSLANTIGMDVNSFKNINGLYTLVLLSERERAEDVQAAQFTDLDENWAVWTGSNLAKLSGQGKMNEEQLRTARTKMERCAKDALEVVKCTENYQHGLDLAVALKLVKTGDSKCLPM